jgi:hypothetical protein
MGHAYTAQFRDKLASGNFVVTPGGARRRELVHVMKPDEAVTGRNGPLQKLNLQSLSATSLVLTKTLGADATPPPKDGWITFAQWTEEPNNIITSMTTTWQVPPAPEAAEGQLIYLFNGLEDAGVQHILQPVLTWGISPDGGGPFWSVASWFVDNAGHAFKSPDVRVNEGDTLQGVMSLTNQTGAGFNYACEFAGIPNTGLHVLGIEQLVTPAVTLECYGIKACSDYPATAMTRMLAIDVATAAGSLDLKFAKNDRVIDCGQSTNVVSNAKGNGQVDLLYRAPVAGA